MSEAKPILLIGAKGMLGRAWRDLLDREGQAFDAVDVDECDITDAASVAPWTSPGRTVVINCAAWTDVDGAEAKEPTALRINADGPANLAAACKQVGALLVHYSTDYVFDGEAATSYAADQTRQPVGAYGRTKAAGEEAIEASGAAYLMVRTSWLYAPWAKNFVRTIAKAASERDELMVVNDQRGRPTSAEHLAATTWKLVQAEARGMFHVTDGDECTWYDFAREIVRLTGANCRVSPCTTDQFPRPAKRPAYSVLDLSKTEAITGPMPSWRENLARVIEKME